MHLVSVALLGLSTNLDNLFIGISFGLRGKRVPPWANAVIGLMSAAAAYVFCRLSSLLVSSGRAPNIAGGAVIMLFGALSLRPGHEDGAPPEKFTPLNAAALGAALAVNCVPAAFGAGLTGLSPAATAVSVGAVSVAAVAVGGRLGALITPGTALQKRLAVLSGVLLLLTGAAEMFV